MVRGKDPRGEARLPPEEITDDRFAIDGKGQRLAHFAAGEDGVFEVDADIGKVRAGALRYLQVRLANERGNDVRGEGAHFDIGGALAQLQRADDSVGDDAKARARDLRGAPKVRRVAFEDDLVVLLLADKPEGS